MSKMKKRVSLLCWFAILFNVQQCCAALVRFGLVCTKVGLAQSACCRMMW